MTKGRAAGWLAVVLVAGSSLAVAADNGERTQDHRVHAQRVAREVRHAMRNVQRDVRHVVRDLVRNVTDAVRWQTFSIDLAFDRHDWTGPAQRHTADVRRSARDESREAREAAREVRAYRQVSPGDDPCAERRNDRRGQLCEVRDSRMPPPIGPLTVDASPNGGIRVEGWSQADVLVRAVVQACADTDAEAKAILAGVRVNAAGGRVSAEGPRRDNDECGAWSVSFQIWAPVQTALSLTAHNGGISLHGMKSDVRLETHNGGVVIEDMGGHVVGETMNGGVSVRLGGATWDGTGLDVSTTNGGVTLSVPADYSAELEASTVNGGFRTDFPITVQGRIDRSVHARLGNGGPLVKVSTKNGGVKIARR